MTAHRASLLGLVGLVFAVFVVATSCNLDSSGFGEAGEELCSEDIHCDDGNLCTEDACGTDGVCTHAPGPDGLFPDGVQGNCTVLECKGGVRGEAPYPEDVDDGNPCTKDSCAGGTATHQVIAGAPCEYQGGLSTCNAQGVCEVPECGHLGAGGEEVQCPASPSACTLSYCDKAKGRCVEEKLDGVPVPGSGAPTECGGQYCVDGAATAVDAPVDSPCALAGGGQGRCSPQGACVECYQKSHCDTGIPESPCHSFGCSANGVCFETTQPDGPLAAQMPGDCRLQVCSGGFYENQEDNADVPFDNDECTQDLCVSGTPSNPPSPPSSPCGLGGLLYCDGMGECKGCITDAQCLGATDCKTPFCDLANDKCSFMFAPMGTVASPGAQSAGDCKTVVCDGNGNFTFQFAMNDPANDGNACTTDTCTAMDNTSHTPVMKGTACSDGGGVVCDALAHCVGAPCTGPAQCPSGTSCVDGVCCESMCGGTCNACSATKKGSGPNGLCGPILSGDPDNDCAGNAVCNSGACVLVPQGLPCVGAVGECATGFCVDGVCCNTGCGALCQACNVAGSVGTCTNLPNGQDPANECAGNASCGGNGACALVPQGSACVGAAGECATGNCVDGVCCNTACSALCQACNLSGSVGSCTNIASGQDPANECAGTQVCNGSGQCRKINGDTCGGAGECLSGNCVDGRCCNTACGALCQACNLTGNLGTCTNIANGQDPANECPGATACNGSGQCALLGPGVACSGNGECQSGNCVDGVCCNTACGALCQACNLSGNVGTCTNIASGQDPANECAGSQVCNGSGACRKINGDTCAAAGECLSGNCADDVCCNAACGGTCQACSAAKTGGANGTCASVPSGQDPDDECAGSQVCNGSGACRKANGDTCAAAGECLSGNCVDGVCCNTACGGTCQACDIVPSVGTCLSIPANTDLDDECAGAQVCNGTNMCVPGPNGTACGATDGPDANCANGNCADGVCCNTACGALCEACDLTGTVGTCTLIPAGTDPDEECPGAQVCNAGVCVGP